MAQDLGRPFEVEYAYGPKCEVSVDAVSGLTMLHEYRCLS